MVCGGDRASQVGQCFAGTAKPHWTATTKVTDVTMFETRLGHAVPCM